MIAEQLQVNQSRTSWIARLYQPQAMAWLLVPGSMWFLAGIYLDGWAHNHGKVDNTFFTPWHAVFYSGYLASALTFALIVLITHLNGKIWQRDLPASIRTGIIAAPLFALAGIVDLWWHTTFGFETGIEPLLSPPHLALAGSMFFVVVANARNDNPQQSALQRIPFVLSTLAGWSVITFMLQFNHPYGIIWPETVRSGDTGVMVGVVGLLANAMLTAGVALWMQRQRMPYGALTFVLVANALLIALMGDEYRFGWGALATGVVCEFIAYALRAQPLQLRLRVSAVLVPTGVCLAYFGVIAATSVVIWPIHIWLGVSVLAGIAGWGLMILAPRIHMRTE
jgi:hypothetical protein